LKEIISKNHQQVPHFLLFTSTFASLNQSLKLTVCQLNETITNENIKTAEINLNHGLQWIFGIFVGLIFVVLIFFWILHQQTFRGFCEELQQRNNQLEKLQKILSEANILPNFENLEREHQNTVVRLTQESQELTDKLAQQEVLLQAFQQQEQKSNQEIQSLKQALVGLERLTDEIQMLRGEYHSQTRDLDILRRNLWIRGQIQSIKCTDLKNVQHLSGGCFGLVMSCDLLLHHQKFSFALKMLQNLGIETVNVEERLAMAELRSLQSLIGVHPNIIMMIHSFLDKPTEQMLSFVDKSIRDFLKHPDNEPRGTLFFLLERHPTNLKDRLAEGVSELQKVKYATHLARGLVFLSENKIAHLDIKPDNLLISENDSLVIADFGVSAQLNDLWQAPTGLFGFGGNPNHLSPEVMNARTQLAAFLPCEKQYSWELGIGLYEILTGKHPFPDYGMTKLSEIGEPPLLDIPERYRSLLDGLLRAVPSNRIPIVTACGELEHLLSTMCGLE
jgi:uncharacterized membrane-anchored protein YhcB (DUF1043 family)